MVGYKDKTFCKFHERCQKGNNCSRALTDKIKVEAMAVNMPISMFTQPPGCYLELEQPEYVEVVESVIESEETNETNKS